MLIDMGTYLVEVNVFSTYTLAFNYSTNRNVGLQHDDNFVEWESIVVVGIPTDYASVLASLYTHTHTAMQAAISMPSSSTAPFSQCYLAVVEGTSADALCCHI